jgi:cation diffusion facilitator family transporter
LYLTTHPKNQENIMNPLQSAGLSLVVGILVLTLKYIAYILTGSVALYSDALESIVNVAAAAVAFVALWIARQPMDHNHPFGHTKAEYFSAAFESILIVIAAMMIIYEAGMHLWAPVALQSVGWGVAVSLLASLINAVLAAYLLHIAKQTLSPAIKADAVHILSDVVTSTGVLIGVGLAWLTGWWLLDPLLALLVAFNILWMGANLLRDSVGGLMDEGISEDELQPIQQIIADQMRGALQVHSLKTRRAGVITFVEFHLVVPANMTVQHSHDICDRLEQALQRHSSGMQINIHVEPDSEVAPSSFITPTLDS